METEIREMLHRRAEDVDASPAIPATTLRRSRQMRIVNSVTVLAASVALCVGAVLGVGALRHDAQPIPFVEQPIEPMHRTVVRDVGAQEIAVGLGAVWLDDQSEIVRVDPATNTVVARIPAIGQGGGFRYYFGTTGLAVGSDAVWATGTGFAETSDGAPQPADTPTGPPEPATAYVWSLLRIDPRSNTWVAAMPAETGSVTGTLPRGIAPIPGAVWVAGEEDLSSGRGAIYRIDTHTEEATTIDVDGPVTGIAALDGLVWAAVDTNRKDARRVVQIDPKTSQIVRSIVLPGTIALQGVAAADDALWVAAIYEDSAVRVVRIDPSSGTVTDRIRVPGPVTRIVPGTGAVWISVQDKTQLYRIDTAINELDGRLPVGGVPDAFALDGSSLWVSVDPDSEGGPKPSRLVRFDL